MQLKQLEEKLYGKGDFIDCIRLYTEFMTKTKEFKTSWEKAVKLLQEDCYSLPSASVGSALGRMELMVQKNYSGDNSEKIEEAFEEKCKRFSLSPDGISNCFDTIDKLYSQETEKLVKKRFMELLLDAEKKSITEKSTIASEKINRLSSELYALCKIPRAEVAPSTFTWNKIINITADDLIVEDVQWNNDDFGSLTLSLNNSNSYGTYAFMLCSGEMSRWIDPTGKPKYEVGTINNEYVWAAFTTPRNHGEGGNET
jgi:hypothetical protein